MPNIIYDLAVRLSFTAPALAGPIASVMGSFNGLKRAAADAQAAVDKLGVAQSNMESVVYKHQAATDALTASTIQLRRATEDYNTTMNNPKASAEQTLRAQERLTLADLANQRAGARLNMTPVPSVVQAGLLSDQAAAQANLDAANAAAGAGKVAQNRMMAGAVIAGAGLIGADVVKHWLDAAMQMQQAMEKVQLATGASADNMARMQSIAQDVSSKVQMSSTDVMNIALLAATSGFNNPRQLMQSLPTLANVAEIAQQMRGVAPDASVPEYVRMAHMFQQYGAAAGDTPQAAAFKNASFNQMLNLAARSLLVSGSTPAELSRVMQYLAPTRAAFNLPPEDIIQFASLAMNVGLTGGRGGGARLGRFAQQLVPTSARGTSKHDQALRFLEGKAGANFTDANGNLSTQFDQNPLINALDVIERFNKAVKSPAERIAVMNAVFGASGSIAAMALANPGAIGRGLNINTELGGGKGALASVHLMQQGMAGVVAGQMKVFSTDITNISQNLGNQLLPALNKVLNMMVALATAVMNFTKQHPLITQFIAVFTALASVMAILGGVALVAVGAFALLDFTIGVGVAELLPFIAAGVAIAAVVGVIVVVLSHWTDITKGLGDAWKGFSMIFGPMISPILSAVAAFTHWNDISLLLGVTFKWLGGRLHDFLQMLGLLQAGPPSGATNAQAPPSGTRLPPGVRPPPAGQHGYWETAHGVAHWVPTPPPHTRATSMPRGKSGIGGGYGHAGTIVHFEPHYHINGPDAKTSKDLADKIHTKSMNDLETHLAQAVRNDTKLNEGLVMAYH